MGDQTLCVTLANRPEEVERLQSLFEEFGEASGLPRKAMMQVMLALEELSLNSILYAFPQGGEHQVTVNITVADGALTCEMRDQGQPFDPFTDTVAPDLETSLMERQVGGLGVHLVKKTMDEVSYCRDGNVNLTRFVKKLG